MGFLLDGRCQCDEECRGVTSGVAPRPLALAVRLRPLQGGLLGERPGRPDQVPKYRSNSVMPLVDPDHGCEDDEAFPSYQASEPVMEKSFAYSKCGKRLRRFCFAGLWD